MGGPQGEPQTSPQHADPHGLGAFLNLIKKAMQEIHVDRRIVGWSAVRHVDHVKLGSAKAQRSLGHQEKS